MHFEVLQVRIPHHFVMFKKSRLTDQSIFGTINGLEVNTMKIKEDIKPISYLKSRSAELLSQINETHRPVIITQNGEPRAVIQDAESYEKMVKSLNLMKILAHSEKDIQEGNTVKQETLFKQIEDNLLKNKTKK